MTIFRTGLLATLLTIASIVVLPLQEAYAQGAKIITYDQARVMRDSVGGKDIAQKVQAIGTSMTTELESEGRALETEGKSLESRTANLTREAIAADATLRTQVETFTRKRAVLQQKTQVRQAELQQTEQVAWTEFLKALQPIVQEVANERSAQIVMERSTIAYAAPNLDVTDAIISKLNARNPSFTVTRARMNLPQAPAETIQ